MSHCRFYQTLSYRDTYRDLEYFVFCFSWFIFLLFCSEKCCICSKHAWYTTTCFLLRLWPKTVISNPLYQLLNPVMRNQSKVPVLTVQWLVIPGVFCVDFCFISYSFPFAMSKCWILHVYEACVINHNTFPCYSDQKYLSVRNQSKVPVLTVQRFISVSFLSILCSRVWFYFFPFAQIIVGFCMCTNTHDNHNTFSTIMNRNIFIASLRTKEMQKLTSK